MANNEGYARLSNGLWRNTKIRMPILRFSKWSRYWLLPLMEPSSAAVIIARLSLFAFEIGRAHV